MTHIQLGQTNRLLGYPADARLLMINADDFGMCHAINAAIIDAFNPGLLCSTTLMVPCPWALHAMHWLGAHPEIPFGVHLTALSDWVDYRWGPVTAREKVPSLIGKDGYFYNFDQMPTFLAQLQLDQLELEFRGQIEAVLSAGLQPSHLDWHALRIGDRMDICDLLFRLARDYGLALRLRGQPWIEKVQGLGFPATDYDFLDSYSIDPTQKAAQLGQLLHQLPAGLSEWALHPALATAELRAIEGSDNQTRPTDFEFLVSPAAKALIEAEGIILLDYRALQTVWQTK